MKRLMLMLTAVASLVLTGFGNIEARTRNLCVLNETQGDNLTGNPGSCYRNGKMNGHWVLRLADGGVEEGPYVHGNQWGEWVFRRSDGTVEDVKYVNDKIISSTTRP